MSYRFLLLLIFSALSIISCDDEQAAGAGDADTYIKFFGASNEDIAYQSRSTPDGGCILLGTTMIDNEGAPVSKIKAIKIDNNGNTQWQKIYPEFQEGNADFSISLIGRSIILMDDGYIIVGDRIKTDGSTPSSLFLMKINDSGADNDLEDSISLNYQDITGVAGTGYNIAGIDIIQDSEGNFRTISNVQLPDGELIGTLFTQINADFTFDKDINCFYDIPGQVDLVKSLHEANDGDFVFAGVDKKGAIDNSELRKVSACAKTISGASSDIVLNPEGNYTVNQVISTNIEYTMIGTRVLTTGKLSIFFALMNSDGTVKNNYPITYTDTRTVDDPEQFPGIGPDAGANAADEEAFTIANTIDGGFVIGGTTLSETAGEEDILLIKTDALGNIQWSKTIGNANQEKATHIQQAPDGGYLIFGNTEFGGIDTMLLIKTDKNGNVN